MADLGRSLLSGQQLSLEAWLVSHPVGKQAAKKNVSRKKKEVTRTENVQLTLF